MPLKQQRQRLNLLRMVLLRPELREGHHHGFPCVQLAEAEEFFRVAWRVDDSWWIVYECSTFVEDVGQVRIRR
jgi:hypothetical protein